MIFEKLSLEYKLGSREPCSEVGKVGVSYRTGREGSGSGSNPGGVRNFLTHGWTVLVFGRMS
jgi:hypothetical protein